ncbi:hypothetical protein N7462_004738 [Penicillium macrosclerotiorum]|uniref:uncharacterized protein n=1 Tax=Penicillium macrosclerotiorum TaxID=303699 RepID=UPI002547E0D6|nr:uncharacterized protein N7462_004738 [Penicillium macrosclerotiorum]KAJ5690346.1 hypothetical protein N7462_004738 [Penicillium macrosclerotiorum]
MTTVSYQKFTAIRKAVVDSTGGLEALAFPWVLTQWSRSYARLSSYDDPYRSSGMTWRAILIP